MDNAKYNDLSEAELKELLEKLPSIIHELEMADESKSALAQITK